MAAPKIKIYQLPQGFTEESMNDVQFRQLDELLPVIDRSQLLIDAVPLTPVTPHFDEPLVPINLGAGRQVADLVVTEGVGVPDGVDWDTVVPVLGALGVQLFDADEEPIPEKYWELRGDGVRFVPDYEIPEGVTISYYERASTPATNWALAHHDLYDGPNPSFNRLLIRVGVSALASATPAGSGYITTPSANSVRATYATWATRSKHFIGDHDNWVADHLRMRPDVFVGKYDYPGDDIGDLAQGAVPKFRELGSYSLNARYGLVTFPEWIDPDDFDESERETVHGRETVVRALYARYAGIKSVTGQRLQAVAGSGGKKFKASADTAYPDSIGKRWVMQQSGSLPLNIRVDGVQVPTIKNVVPYEELTVKTGPG